MEYIASVSGCMGTRCFWWQSTDPRTCAVQTMVTSVTSCSAAKLCLTLCNPMDYSMPGLPVPQPSGVCPVHVHWVGDAIQPFHPLLPSSLALNLSQHQVFSNESGLHIRWPKYWSFSISPSDEYSGSISFRIDWSDLLAIQVTRSSIFLEKPGLCILMDYFLILTRWLTHYKIYCEDQTKHIHKLHGDSLLILFFPDTIT